MRVGSLRLVLRVAFLALAASLLLASGAPAASSVDYRCCFRLDAVMTGRLDTVYDDLPGKPSDDERASFTFMTSELLVYSFAGGRRHLRRAFTRRGGPWPQNGPGRSPARDTSTRNSIVSSPECAPWCDVLFALSRVCCTAANYSVVNQP